MKIPVKHTKICDNCSGNGYINVVDNQGQTNVHQCWVCEFALIASGRAVAISHNSYVRAYNGLDVMTIMATEKDIKRHIYDKTVIHFKELKR